VNPNIGGRYPNFSPEEQKYRQNPKILKAPTATTRFNEDVSGYVLKNTKRVHFYLIIGANC
jgi:hypothetical protein